MRKIKKFFKAFYKELKKWGAACPKETRWNA